MAKKQPKGTGEEMTVAKAGKRGGRKTAATPGHEFYQEIGRKGGLKIAAERDREFFREIGRQGGLKRAGQHEGSKEVEGKVSLEEACRRGGQRKMLNRIRQKNTRKKNW